MELLRQILPYLLILFFIIKTIKEPLYFLGIPFLIFMSDSIFINNDFRLFRIPGGLSPAQPFMWFIFFWLLSGIIHFYKNKEGNINSHRLNEMDFCVIGLILISIIGLGISVSRYSFLIGVFNEFLNLISLFICYFIIKIWTSKNKPEVIINFLFSLVVINSIASLLFILHQGLHFKIYPQSANIIQYIMGEEITREFYFMPQLLPFSIAFLLVFRGKNIFIYTLLLVLNLLAIFVSYTRSALVIAVIIFIFYFFIEGLKKRSFQTVFKNLLIYSVLGVIGFIMVSKILPSSTSYLVNRFAEITENKNFSESNNLKFRFIMAGNLISKIEDNDKLVGMNSVTEMQIPLVKQANRAASDMVWAGVIFRWGFIGLILFILLYVFSVKKIYSFYMKSQGALSDLALLLFLVTISQILESFVSWTFMCGHGLPTGLLDFAMISAVVGFRTEGTVAERDSLIKNSIQ